MITVSAFEYETESLMRMDEAGQVYLADTLLGVYFQHDYYFMCGDNTNDRMTLVIGDITR